MTIHYTFYVDEVGGKSLEEGEGVFKLEGSYLLHEVEEGEGLLLLKVDRIL